MEGEPHNKKPPPPAKEHGRNKSNEVVLFLSIYVGFIVCFLAYFNTKVFEHFVPPAKSINGLLQEMKFYDNRGQGLENYTLLFISAFIVVPLLALLRMSVRKYVFAPLAENWAGLQPNTAKHKKFTEQGFLAVHYLGTTLLGVAVLYNKPWWPPGLLGDFETQRAISASQAEREKDQLDLGLRVLYFVQLAFYLLEFVTLWSTPPNQRRADYVVYFLHHVYTVLLLAGSWVSYNHRIGSLVLWLHDVGDIFLPIGKLFSYAEEHLKRTRSNLYFETMKVIGTSFFVMFALAFAIPRIVLFGSLIYQGIFTFKWYKCCEFDLVKNVCGACYMGSMWQLILLSILGFLYPMHIYWFYLILRMAYVLVFSDAAKSDVRSDGEEEDIKEE